MSRPLVHIIDGSGYIFRAYYAIRSLTTSSGDSTNAVYGFSNMLEKLLREEQPSHMAIVFDTGSDNFRHTIFPEYKSNRSPPPEDLTAQIPEIHRVVDAFKLRRFVVDGVEADDVIATLTRMALEDDRDVRLITGDKDLMQLVDDRVTLWEPMRGNRFGPAEVEEKMGVPPTMVADALALAGDSSDNIPGVDGVGPKKAARLLSDHGDLDGVLAAAAAGKIKGKMGQNLKDQADQARLSARLVALKDDVELDLDGPGRTSSTRGRTKPEAHAGCTPSYEFRKAGLKLGVTDEEEASESEAIEPRDATELCRSGAASIRPRIEVVTDKKRACRGWPKQLDEARRNGGASPSSSRTGQSGRRRRRSASRCRREAGHA